MTIYQYERKLAESKTAVSEERWRAFYRAFFGAKAEIGERIPDNTPDQIAGIDRVITLVTGEKINVDEKIITRSYPHICLEVMSNVEKKKLGWVQRDDIKTDFVAYTIFPFETCYFINLKVVRSWWRSPRGRDVIWSTQPKQARTRVGYKYYTSSFFPVPIDVMVREFGESIRVTVTDDELENTDNNDIQLIDNNQ